MTTPIISNEEMIDITKKLDNFKNLVYGKIVFAKELEMQQKNKKTDFSVSYWLHQVLIYQRIY